MSSGRSFHEPLEPTIQGDEEPDVPAKIALAASITLDEPLGGNALDVAIDEPRSTREAGAGPSERAVDGHGPVALAATAEGQIPEIASERSSLTTVLDQLPRVIEKFSAIEDQTKKVVTDVGEVTGKIKDNPLLRLGAPKDKAAPPTAEAAVPAQKEKPTRNR